MKIIFLGTSTFARDVLNILIKSKHEILAIVCQPDKPNARGNKIEICEAKKFGLEHNIPVLQFAKIRRDGVEKLTELNPDIMVTASYGQLLSQEVLDIAKYGVINVHGSVLPKYRGASPIQYAILNGEKETGITIMKTEIGMDDGDILLMQKMAIDDNDTTQTLMDKLAIIGGNMLVEALNKIEEGTIKRIPQIHEDATFTKLIKKEEAFLDFNQNAEMLNNKIRALNPNPIAKIKIDDIEYKIFSALPEHCECDAENGEIIVCNAKQGFIIKCAENSCLHIKEIQAPNGKKLNIKDFLNGKRFEVGKKL